MGLYGSQKLLRGLILLFLLLPLLFASTPSPPHLLPLVLLILFIAQAALELTKISCSSIGPKVQSKQHVAAHKCL